MEMGLVRDVYRCLFTTRCRSITKYNCVVVFFCGGFWLKVPMPAHFQLFCFLLPHSSTSTTSCFVVLVPPSCDRGGNQPVSQEGHNVSNEGTCLICMYCLVDVFLHFE